ncbi:ribokinase [Nostoc carneum NIES-2107]|nr:ribokinase [Nostoc carneum NIES-2107]
MKPIVRLLAGAVEGFPWVGPLLREIVEIVSLSNSNEGEKSEALQKISEVLQRTNHRDFHVVALSACNYDYFIKVDKIFPDYECKIKGEDAHPGGSGANSIYGLTKLGKKTAIVSCVNDDEEGRKIIQSFQDIPIDTRLLIVDDTNYCHTGRTTVFVENSGKRLIAVRPGINEYLSRILKERQLLDELRDVVKNSRILHLSSFTGIEELHLQELILQEFKDKDTIVSLTPGALYVEKGLEELSPILAHTNVMFLYVEQLDTLLKSSKNIKGFRENISLKKKINLFFKWKLSKKMNHAMILVIKDNLKIQSGCILENYISVATNAGENMSFFSHSNVNFTVGDGSKIALDTTGVGDAVVAAFLYGLLEGENIKGCADLAFVLATHVSTRFGARTGLLDASLLEEEKRKLRLMKS